MEAVQLKEIIIEVLHEDVRLPEYVSDGDSGMDVRAREHCLLIPGQTHLFKLGFKLGMPKHPWHASGWRWECQVRPRSGVSLKTSLVLPNAPGTIDNFYTSEVGVILRNQASLKEGVQRTVRALDGRDIDLQDLPAFLKPKSGTFVSGTIWVKPGDRIAQLVFVPIIRPLKVTLGKVEKNREGGFGSSGIE